MYKRENYLNKLLAFKDQREIIKVINSFRLQGNIDIYITGSNAYLLSSELSTLLSGRYVELKMLPLSFKEFEEKIIMMKIKTKKNILMNI